MRTFRIWSEGDCFRCSVYGSNEICPLSPHNGRPQIFLCFKAIGQTNQSLDSSIPPSSAPSIATLLTAISDETDRNICSLKDSMDFLCSEEVIRVRDTLLCYKYVPWNGFFFFFFIKLTGGLVIGERPHRLSLSLSLFLSLCAQYFNQLILFIYLQTSF